MFFIEMGQGIVGDPDLVVSTSALYSCALIAGRNQMSGAGGAFHYPAETLTNKNTSIIADMETWLYELTPDDVILVFAPYCAFGALERNTTEDRRALIDWSKVFCPRPPRTLESSIAGMEYLNTGTFAAGNPKDLSSDFDKKKMIDLSGRPAGRYRDQGSYELFGQDRNSKRAGGEAKKG